MAAPTMPRPKTGPIHSDTATDGTRWYIHPTTQERFLSVTTALKVINKEALVFWAAKVVAEEAMEYLPKLVRASRHRPCGQTGQNRCGTCRDCAVVDLKGRPAAKRDEAADLGSEVHHVCEQYALTGQVIGHSDEAAPFIKQYLAWFATFKPTYDASEMTVFSREHGYAGTADGVIRLGWAPPKHKDLIGKPLVMDIKTGKGVYAEAALQMSAYRHAEAILLPDGTEEPMLATEPTALVLHLRPDSYQLHPVPADMPTLGGFLSALSLYRWQTTRAPEAIGRAMYKPAEGATAKSAAEKPTTTRAKKTTTTAAKPSETAAPRRSRTTRQAIDPFAAHRNGHSAGDQLADDSIPF